MSIRNVVLEGYGPFGSIPLVVTSGFVLNEGEPPVSNPPRKKIMNNEKLVPTTLAATKEFTITFEPIISISATGFDTGEVVEIEKLYGETWGPMTDYEKSLENFYLTADDNVRVIKAPGRYRFKKGVTTGQIGFYLDDARTW